MSRAPQPCKSGLIARLGAGRVPRDLRPVDGMPLRREDRDKKVDGDRPAEVA
jgi:hypothetical protein